MSRFPVLIAIVSVAAICSIGVSADESETRESGAAPPKRFTLSPPEQDGPVEVLFDFELYDINEIDGVTETFEFTGVMTLTHAGIIVCTFEPDFRRQAERIHQAVGEQSSLSGQLLRVIRPLIGFAHPSGLGK